MKILITIDTDLYDNNHTDVSACLITAHRDTSQSYTLENVSLADLPKIAKTATKSIMQQFEHHGYMSKADIKNIWDGELNDT